MCTRFTTLGLIRNRIENGATRAAPGLALDVTASKLARFAHLDRKGATRDRVCLFWKRFVKSAAPQKAWTTCNKNFRERCISTRTEVALSTLAEGRGWIDRHSPANEPV